MFKMFLNIPMLCKKKVLFWLLICSWFSYSYMYVGNACNANPTSTYPPWNAHLMLPELFKWFECVDPGRNSFDDLEQLIVTSVINVSQHIWVQMSTYGNIYHGWIAVAQTNGATSIFSWTSLHWENGLTWRKSQHSPTPGLTPTGTMLLYRPTTPLLTWYLDVCAFEVNITVQF